jgi:hypothetical protein
VKITSTLEYSSKTIIQSRWSNKSLPW